MPKKLRTFRDKMDSSLNETWTSGGISGESPSEFQQTLCFPSLCGLHFGTKTLTFSQQFNNHPEGVAQLVEQRTFNP